MTESAKPIPGAEPADSGRDTAGSSGPASDEPERQLRIRRSVERARTALFRLRSAGRGTATTRARIEEGLRCRVDDGRWSFTADLGDKVGGDGAGPDPGVYGRAALASCLAIGYALWAAHAEVPITHLEVQVEADYDTRAQFGIGDESPAYRKLRWIVEVESPAPEEQVREVLRVAEVRSPYLALFRDPHELDRELRIQERP